MKIVCAGSADTPLGNLVRARVEKRCKKERSNKVGMDCNLSGRGRHCSLERKRVNLHIPADTHSKQLYNHEHT